MPAESSQPPPEPIAIVGIGCRFPGGVNDTDSFWELLRAGRSAVSEVPADRWDAVRYHCPDVGAPGKLVTRWGGFVDQLEEFDAAFFGITPRESARMDPQQRWLLEIAWEALEDALCPPSSLRGSATGVFVGLSNSDYGQIQQKFVERIDGYTNSGNSLSIAANRISYQFDLRGPSLVVDTACSSGLVAVALACRHIWSGECESALAGAASALILPGGSMGFSKASMLSPTGRCHAFDARADGYVRSEGAGMLFLEPLSRALARGHRVHAVIRSCVVNQDGRTSSMTVPSLEAQRRMVGEALAVAGVSPAHVGYVEAHGTGTPVGDPIEARALGEALSPGRDRPCLLGSVKTNLGHLETAAGLAGIIKAALVLEHRRVPPSLNFSIPNPHIPFDELKLRVVTELADLPDAEGGGAFVAVNSFGFGGTNAHALLEAAPPVPCVSDPPGTRPLILALSARCPAALRALAARYAELLARTPDAAARICAGAAQGRAALEHRMAAVGGDAAELASALAGGGIAGRPAEDAKPVFVFTGQGAQWPGMGRRLLEVEPVFREAVDGIDSLFSALAGWSLRDELARGEGDSRIHRTEFAQPAIFAIQAGLVALWESWGVRPSAVVGHSVGEVAAAHAAGILSLREAVDVVFYRSRLQARMAGQGRMAVVGIPHEQIRERLAALDGAVEVAGLNSPSLVTLAGGTEPLEALVESLAADGRFVRWLPVDCAFHTRQMDPICGELRDALRGLAPADSAIPFVSTVEADAVKGTRLDAGYWWRNVREPVRFGSAIEGLIAAGRRTFLEIGPHHALESSIRECLASRSAAGRVFHSLSRGADDSRQLATNLAGLHVAGTAVDWRAFPGARVDPSVRLPGYPWQRTRCWLESPKARRARTGGLAHPLLGMSVEGPQPRWEMLLDSRAAPWLGDHRFWKRIVLPAAAFVEIGLAVGREVHAGAAFALEDLALERILFLSGEDSPTLCVEYDDEDRRFRVFSCAADSGTWNLHATGRIVAQPPPRHPPAELGRIRKTLPRHTAHWDYYEEFRKDGYEFGPAFRQIEQVWHGGDEALAEVVVRRELLEDAGRYHMHPALIDACFQTMRAAASGFADGGPEAGWFLPDALAGFEIGMEALPDRFWVHARVTERTDDRIAGDLWIHDNGGATLARFRGLELARVRSGRQTIEDCFYEFDWVESPLPANDGDAGARKILLLADAGGVGESLAAPLAERGVEMVRADAEPSDPGQLHRVLERFFEGGSERAVIAHLWPLDDPEDAALDTVGLSASRRAGVHSLLEIAQFLDAHGIAARVCCIAYAADRGIARLASSAIPGFLRVAANEMPGVEWNFVLHDPNAGRAGVNGLIEEVLRGGGEAEVARIDGVRHVRRMRRIRAGDLSRRTRAARLPDGAMVPFRIESERPGTLERLVCNEVRRPEPGPDEVEVRVAAAGINFRDLMKVLGVYPGEPEELRELGDDFAGVVVRVGSRVDDLRPGDEVAGIAAGCFGTHVAADRRMVFPKPAGMSFAEASSLPTVFLTTHHALVDLARLREGESVLIHAAAGGVGFAAIQVASSLGLEIFATAGSEEKRRLLRGMGIEHVMDSRSFAFAEEISRITNGRGVDAVLNSLSGEFLAKSLSVLAPFGRFLEIGKVDVHARRRFALHALRNNSALFVIDMAQVLRTERGSALLAGVRKAFDAGIYRSIPCRVFSADRAEDAFREMSKGWHVGKLVLDLSDGDLAIGRCSEAGSLFSDDVAYVISGGAGGFGFEVAKWLARNGARKLALLSRSGPAGAEILAEIERLRGEGVEIEDARVDITDGPAVAKAVRRIEEEMAPVGGVIHAAMVLNDRTIADLGRDSFDEALNPKALGAWNLHTATLHRDIEFFVCFSSVSAAIGSLRQANYCAGNAFLDELARHRRAGGRAGLSIGWGAITGAGFVDRNAKTRAYLESAGIQAFSIDEALRVLEILLARDAPQVTAARMDWGSLIRLLPAVGSGRLYEPIVSALDARAPSGSARNFILAAPLERRAGMIGDFLAGQVAAVFGTDAAALDRVAPVSQLGLDSIMAIELLNRIESELGIAFPMGSILNGPSIQQLAGPVLEALHASEERSSSADA